MRFLRLLTSPFLQCKRLTTKQNCRVVGLKDAEVESTYRDTLLKCLQITILDIFNKRKLDKRLVKKSEALVNTATNKFDKERKHGKNLVENLYN
jgi:hypothetical protein